MIALIGDFIEEGTTPAWAVSDKALLYHVCLPNEHRRQIKRETLQMDIPLF